MLPACYQRAGCPLYNEQVRPVFVGINSAIPIIGAAHSFKCQATRYCIHDFFEKPNISMSQKPILGPPI